VLENACLSGLVTKFVFHFAIEWSMAISGVDSVDLTPPPFFLSFFLSSFVRSFLPSFLSSLFSFLTVRAVELKVT